MAIDHYAVCESTIIDRVTAKTSGYSVVLDKFPDTIFLASAKYPTNAVPPFRFNRCPILGLP
jgi:hypothetical protein